jgi:hypothetical protein
MMVNDSKIAQELVMILDSSKAFVGNGGLRRVEHELLKENHAVFAKVSLLVAIIEDSATAANGSWQWICKNV